MALDMRQRQTLKLAQQLVMTPQLQQAIKLLQLSRMEMLETVQQEMVENPVLEEVQEGETPDEESGIDSFEQETLTSSDSDNNAATDIDWGTFLENYYYTYNGYNGDHYQRDEDEDAGFEAYTSKKTTLQDHLIWQLRMSNFTFEEEQVGIYIIGNLDEDGYLRITEEEIAAETGTSLEFVRNALAKVQNFDPVGIAARDLQECLLIQAGHWGFRGSLVENIIKNHLQLVEKKDPKLIAKNTKSTEDEAREALKVILGMEPKPGRSFSDEKVQYIIPDIYVHKVGDEYVVVLNEDGLPKLRVSNYYRQLLQGKGKSGDLTKGYIQEKLRSAVWMIKSIQQRQRTIYKVAKSIVKFQREFFDRGVEYLKPLSLKDVALDISMHESTVSRVTNNKYVHTPQGIYELKFFFNSKVNTTSGGEIAAESVKQKIIQIITSEDTAKPLSDQEIARILREMGVDIARRTVTKYREAMNILSSSKRKKYM